MKICAKDAFDLNHPDCGKIPVDGDEVYLEGHSPWWVVKTGDITAPQLEGHFAIGLNVILEENDLVVFYGEKFNPPSYKIDFSHINKVGNTAFNWAKEAGVSTNNFTVYRPFETTHLVDTPVPDTPAPKLVFSSEISGPAFSPYFSTGPVNTSQYKSFYENALGTCGAPLPNTKKKKISQWVRIGLDEVIEKHDVISLPEGVDPNFGVMEITTKGFKIKEDYGGVFDWVDFGEVGLMANEVLEEITDYPNASIWRYMEVGDPIKNKKIKVKKNLFHSEPAPLP